MTKKLMALALALCMVFAITACSGQPADTGSTAESTAADDSQAAGDTASDELIVVGFSQVGSESDWRTANTASMKETFTEENGFKLIFDDAQQKQENQITAIRSFIQQEVDYIVLAPTGESGWDTVLAEAQKANIPVIIVDRMVSVSDEDLFTCWVGSDFRNEGDKAVEWMQTELKDKGGLNIVHLQGTIGSSAQIGRSDALDAGIEANKDNKWNLVAKQTGEFTQAKGQEVMESILKQGDDINVVYCENDNMAFGAIDAIEAAGKTCGIDGDITVISFDATKAGLTTTLEGKITYNVECNPLHGPRVKELIEKLEAGETPDKLAYVDETAFDAREITQEIIDARAY